MKALILTADGFEDSELLVPYEKLRKEGFEVEIASIRRGTITGKHGHSVEVDKTLEEVDPDEYDALILPGGRAPETLRKEKRVLEIVRRFVDDGKTVAAICHGPQILISAGRIAGRRATGYRKIARELEDAGALYEEREVVVDGNLITSRVPADLDAFVREIVKRLKAEKEG
ncbi:type 1 glutamine amidotransferase domain-containing protein [Hydrogenimonas sp.]|jgi:protease I|uniref:type 1 glutamine amidotransferase domain-containing protein n=1 Tax=Hydrogenimonas sp. TaxID=2231112 RepID=UPI0026025980|nr:type 1 glutamine amidotransferase domain-containing protein [Hydrogenimonas sp.]